MSTLGLQAIEKVIGDLVCSDIKVQIKMPLSGVPQCLCAFVCWTSDASDFVLSTKWVGVIVGAVTCLFQRRAHMMNSHSESPRKASTPSHANSDTKPDPAVTERTLLQSDLFLRASEVFGSEGPTWMAKPHDLLDGKSPKEYATNEARCSKVSQILNAIKHGGVA